jgi:hypothetical protein
MAPSRAAAGSLVGIAVICSLDLAGGGPLYLRLLFGAGMVVALLAVVQLPADDLPGWLLAVGVTAGVAGAHGAVVFGGLPHARSSGVGGDDLALLGCSAVVFGAARIRYHEWCSSDHAESDPGGYARRDGAIAAPGRGR